MADNTDKPLPTDPNQAPKSKKKGIIIAAAAAGAIAVGAGVLLTPRVSPVVCVYGPPVHIEDPDTAAVDTLVEPGFDPEPCVYGPPTYFENDEANDRDYSDR